MAKKTPRATAKKKTAKKAAGETGSEKNAATTAGAGADKLDLFKQHKSEYATPKKPALIECGPALCLAIDGQGEPGGGEFQDKIGAMYSIAYTLKFTCKFAGRDYKVCALEALWWLPGGKQDFAGVPKSQWLWKLLIRTPDFVTKAQLADAVKTLKEKEKGGPFVDKVKLEKLKEGRCVQMLHVGPYDDCEGVISEMAEFMKDNGLKPHGRHHEIYLSDPRRVAPEKLRTIMRQPVK